jgi:hypothetical protein
VPLLHVGPRVPDVAEKASPDTKPHLTEPLLVNDMVKEHELAIVKLVVVPVSPIGGLGEQPFTV